MKKLLTFQPIKSLQRSLKPLLKVVLVATLVMSLFFGSTHDAFAAPGRGGGRMGGGSFRSAPSRSYSAPRGRSYGGSYGGGYGGGYNRGYGGGGGFFFMPSPWMFIGGGGGGLFGLLVLIAVGGYLFQTFRQATESGDGLMGGSAVNPKVSVAKLQVGLLADARSLRDELNAIALKSNTSSNAGLSRMLQETTLSLLRHPEYWVYSGAQERQSQLLAAESEFNRLVLAERSKVSGETLSNVSGELKQKDTSALAVAAPSELAERDPGAYIVVTLVVGCQGKLALPKIESEADVKNALRILGSVPSDRLMAAEVLWTPQANGDVLTRDEMMSDYPHLALV
jgi:uncharacterized membrane protein